MNAHERMRTGPSSTAPLSPPRTVISRTGSTASPVASSSGQRNSNSPKFGSVAYASRAGRWRVNQRSSGGKSFAVTADVAIVCNTMYQEPLVDGGMWVDKRRMIIKKYMSSGWLLVDVVSCFPYFIIGLIVEGAAGPDGEGADDLMPLRLIKLVRMLKLARCLKAAAKVGPYIQEVLMGSMEMTYAKLLMQRGCSGARTLVTFHNKIDLLGNH